MTTIHNRDYFDKVFNDYDRDHRGYIDSERIEDLLQKYYKNGDFHPSKEDIHHYAEKFRGDCDGRVCFDQFYHRMRELQSQQNIHEIEMDRQKEVQRNREKERQKQVEREKVLSQPYAPKEKCEKSSMENGPMKCTPENVRQEGECNYEQSKEKERIQEQRCLQSRELYGREMDYNRGMECKERGVKQSYDCRQNQRDRNPDLRR